MNYFKRISGFALAAFLCFFLSVKIHAQYVQDTTLLYKIDTKDGNEFYGHILSRDSLKVEFLTEAYGPVFIRTDNIKKIEMITADKIRQGKIWIENFQDSRYFFSPNGYGLRKKEAYYQNVWVLYNQFSVGLSKNFSIGGGIVPLFLFAGAPTPIWLIPKVSIPIVKDKFNLGAGALVGYVVGEDEAGFGIAYATGTIGSRDKNLSLGLGYGWIAGEFTDQPLVNLCCLIRTSPKSYFMSENYYIPTSDSYVLLFSLGGRSIIKRIGLDYGLFIPLGSEVESFIAIPWLGITAPLSKKQNFSF